jgi:hypothetical protein
MKKLFVTTFVLGTLAAASSFAADTSNLSGFSVGANAEFSKGSSSATDGTSDNGNTSALGLQGRYDFPVAPNFGIGLGASYSSSNHKAGTYASGAEATIGNRYSLDVMPTVALANNYQLYGKLDIHGVGYGIGLRQMLDKNMYWQVAYDLNKFNDVTFNTGTTSSIQENVFSIGVGYKF